MNAAEIIARLKAIEPELRSAGLDALYLFGSQARGDAGKNSDVDLTFDVSEACELRFSLINQAELMLRLSEVLGTKVDFVERRCLRPRIRGHVEGELVPVFGR